MVHFLVSMIELPSEFDFAVLVHVRLSACMEGAREKQCVRGGGGGDSTRKRPVGVVMAVDGIGFSNAFSHGR